MADIIDFNSRKKQIDALGEIASVLGADMPQNAMMERTIELIADRMSRMMLVTEIAGEASKVIKSAGLDPDEFELEEDTFDAFMQTKIEEGDIEQLSPQQLWNGPRFYCQGSGYEARVASSVVFDDEGDEEVMFGIDLLKLKQGAANWSVWGDGKWQGGPPKDAFDYLDALREDDGDDEDWDDEDSDDEDWDDEDWENSIDSMMLMPNVIEALHMAGIDSIDELKQMTNAQLLAIKGIGKKSLADIREALKYED